MLSSRRVVEPAKCMSKLPSGNLLTDDILVVLPMDDEARTSHDLDEARLQFCDQERVPTAQDALQSARST